MFFFLGSRVNNDAMALGMLSKLFFVTDKVAAFCIVALDVDQWPWRNVYQDAVSH